MLKEKSFFIIINVIIRDRLYSQGKGKFIKFSV